MNDYRICWTSKRPIDIFSAESSFQMKYIFSDEVYLFKDISCIAMLLKGC